MSIIKKMRKQDAVLWTWTGVPDVYDSPVQIKARWEDATQIQGLNEVIRYQANIYVDRDLKTGDYLLLGALTSSTPADPREADSWLVQQYNKIPNLKAKEWLRSCYAYPSHLTLLTLHARGVGPVVYKRVTGASVGRGGILAKTETNVAIAVALRNALGVVEVEESRGRLLLGDISWDVPKFLLPDEPNLEDWIQDGDGVRWNITQFEENRLLRDVWWRIVTRRAASS